MKGKDMKKFLIALACCSLSACYYYVPEDTYVEEVYSTPGYYGQTTYITPSTSHVYVEQQPDVVYINNTPDVVYIDSSAPHHHHAPAPQRYHYPQHHKAAPQPKPHKAAPQPKPHHDNHAKEAPRGGFGGPERVVNIPGEAHGKKQPGNHAHHGGHKR